MSVRIDNIEYQIMSELSEHPPDTISSADLINAINDGLKDVTAKAFCVEEATIVSTSIGNRFILVDGYGVNSIELVSSGLGLEQVIPQVLGHCNIDGNSPQFWFQWGPYVVIEPVPDAVYQLRLFSAVPPATEAFGGVFYEEGVGFTDTSQVTWDNVGSISGLPDEFYPSIVDFALYVLSIKLKRWGRAAHYYNIYIANLAQRKEEYILREAEKRSAYMIPRTVNIGREQSWQR